MDVMSINGECYSVILLDANFCELINVYGY